MGDKSTGLGHFLRTRRDRLRPADLGREAGAGRRVPGLRREELAQRAGLSPDYLVRLEQGRDIHPSPAVLGALAAALDLDADERDHLYALAGAARRGRADCRRRRPRQQVRPGTQRLLAAVHGSPALILGRWLEVLDQNPAAVALYGDLRGGNLLRFLFLDDASRDLFPHWEQVAERTVGFLRATTVADDADRGTCELAGELLLGSGTFARLWAGHHVHHRMFGSTRFAHPQLGALTLDHEILALPDPDQWLLVHTAAPDSTAHTDLMAHLMLRPEALRI
ncbi:helix-turn-helix transcriptional regulator [Actinoplanes sp. NBRC 101535]|uniref:helix-turn-helix transcriptional regulator n=1 Tax=Actinoplanes sp. NBRC 101535 TaxID=3032196 RepID=UPI0024A5EA0E|nr:helix-turn-helix transcriptional regulator [Actinoplanes sp. NBRC 101535]GLY04121.1 transcriptional regulator [Actinoplanes sp. NBRC 101535]